MLLWLLLLVLPSSYSLNCSYIFDGKRYTRQNILTVHGFPMHLQIDPTTNDLIYSIVDSKLFFTGSIYILRNGTSVKVDINDTNVAASDFDHNRVFVGTDNGLKLLNNKNQASLDIMSFQNKRIIRLFKPVAEDKLFIITQPNKTVHQLDLNTFEKSTVDSIPSAWQVVADIEGNIFYVTDSLEYRVLLKDFKDSIKFVGLDHAKKRALTMDDNNRAIAVVDDGLYWLRPDSIIPKKLMNLEFIPRGVLFDCDEIYISTLNTLYKYSNNECSSS